MVAEVMIIALIGAVVAEVIVIALVLTVVIAVVVTGVVVVLVVVVVVGARTSSFRIVNGTRVRYCRRHQDTRDTDP